MVGDSAARMTVDGTEFRFSFREAAVAQDEKRTEYSWEIRPLAGAQTVLVEIDQGSVRTGHLRSAYVKHVYAYLPKITLIYDESPIGDLKTFIYCLILLVIIATDLRDRRRTTIVD